MESNIKAYEDSSKERVITKKDLNKMAWRSLFLQASFNYERMQAGGWLYSLLPGLKKIHKNKKDLSNSMKDHLQLFNTHPFLVTFIMGIIIAMEESKEERSTIRSIKIATMGPLGGIGDSLFWLTALPICAGIGASMGVQGNPLGAVIFLLLINTIHFACRFGFMHYGYNTGVKAIKVLKENTKRVAHAASIVGITVVGALIASNVNLKLGEGAVIVGGSTKIAVQTQIFDKILLNVLPLGYTLLMYKLLKKGLSPVALIGITVVLGVVGSYLHIF